MEEFAFGANWERYLRRHVLKEKTAGIQYSERFQCAQLSLQMRLGNIKGKRFLDIGSGSGLFSLAAHRLGAIVHSFDRDPESVECTRMLKSCYGHPQPEWTIEQGSAIYEPYLKQLGQFDIVYSWGVLHHTGELWRACRNAANRVAPGGLLMVALYNDQGWRSTYWRLVKRAYVRSKILRYALIAAHLPLPLARFAVRALRRRLTLERGMDIWTDYIDWLGGYPFEVSTPAEVIKFFEQMGFTLKHHTPATSGCNEFVFQRTHGT